jgi:hypothetical protein
VTSAGVADHLEYRISTFSARYLDRWSQVSAGQGKNALQGLGLGVSHCEHGACVACQDPKPQKTHWELHSPDVLVHQVQTGM